MKTIIFILTILFSVQSAILFAGKPDLDPRPVPAKVKLAPVAPREATFEEPLDTVDLSGLKPVAPLEADFPECEQSNPDPGRKINTNHDEISIPRTMNSYHLAPTIPTEADFE